MNCVYEVIGSVAHEFDYTYYTASTYDKALDWFKENVDGNKYFGYHDEFIITKVLIDSTIVNNVAEFERVGINWRMPI